jgi:CelD/BcsL family acetyltransferase involved in cellulose biosynthesis
MGELVHTVYGPDDTARVMEWLPRFVEEKNRKHPDAFLQDHGICYFGLLVEEGLPSGIVNASSMALDGETISWEINFLLDGTLYGYSCASDHRFRNIALGALHLTATVDWAIGQGLDAYDFLWGDEDYKNSFTDAEFVVMGEFELRSSWPSSRLRCATRATRDRLARTLGKVSALPSVWTRQGLRRLELTDQVHLASRKNLEATSRKKPAPAITSLSKAGENARL